MIITLEDYKKYQTQEMLNSFYNGSLIDEGIDFVLLEMFQKLGTNLLIDVGANQGNYEKFCQEKLPDMSVLAFEPDTRIYDQCLKQYESDKIKIFNKGILNKNCKMNFYFSEDSTQTSIKYSNSKNYMIIDCNKLDKYYDYIKQYKNPFIKIDAEGVEPEIIYSANKIIKNTKNLILFFEYSYKWNFNEKETYKLFKYLTQSGFIIYRLNAFGLERVPIMYYDYLKQFHFSNIFAMKGFRFNKNDIINIDGKFGKTEMFPILLEREVLIKD